MGEEGCERDDESTHDASSRLASALSSCGFDICHPFHPSWYNTAVEKANLTDQLRFLPVSKCPEHPSAFLIGNTRHLWEIFLDWVEKKRTSGKANLGENPLDEYTKEAITNAVERSAHLFSNKLTFNDENSHAALDDRKYYIFWSDTTITTAAASSTFLVSMQRIAQVSGFCFLDDTATMMAVNPVFGTWMSFRAAVVFYPATAGTTNASADRSSSTTNNPASPCPPKLLQCLVSSQEQEMGRALMMSAMAVAEEGNNGDDVHKYWIAIRDCISVGRDKYRFTENQLLYHYTKDKRYLCREKVV